MIERISHLTLRELEIARLVEQGLFNKEIARALKIRPNTVKTHLSNIFAKFNIENRTELAIRMGDANYVRRLQGNR